MEITEYIEQAKVTYPNGYADYISQYPAETPELWAGNFEDGRTEQANGYSFAQEDILKMNEWDTDRFWTFMAIVEYNYSKTFGK